MTSSQDTDSETPETRHRKDLTEADKDLWRQVAQQIQPLKSAKKRASLAPVLPSPRPLEKPPFHFSFIPPRFPSPSFQPSSNVHPTASSRRRLPEIKPEAYLDLHGLTLEQGHRHLMQFLLTAQNRRYKLVLVITGKGQAAKRSTLKRKGVPPDVLRDPRETFHHLVPRWLAEPIFDSIISTYLSAKPCHGGSGALYVRLKRLPQS